MFLSMPPELLNEVVGFVPRFDVCCVALVCKTLYGMCKIRYPTRWKTAITCSLSRTLWAVGLNVTPRKSWYMHAALHGQVAVMQWMFLHGVYPDADDESQSPMHCAAEHGHLNVMKWLYDHMVSISHRPSPPFDWAPVHVAANFGHRHILQWLASKGVSLTLPLCRRIAQQPIDFAAVNNHLPVVQYLIDRGVSPRVLQDNISFHTMAVRGHLDMMMYVYERGVAIPNVSMCEALRVPATSSAAQDVRMDMHPIHYAATTKNLAMLKFLHESGAALDTLCRSGMQPIHYVLLISYRDLSADHMHVHLVGKLDVAAVIPCLQYLADNGMSLTVQDNYGRQPIHLAGLGNNYEIVKWLHERGVSLDVADNCGFRLCHMWHQNDDCITRMLVAKGISLMTPDNSGMTLMDHVAAVFEARLEHQNEAHSVVVVRSGRAILVAKTLSICTRHSGCRILLMRLM